MAGVDYGAWRPYPGIDACKLLVSSNGWVRTRVQGGKRCLGQPSRGTLTDHGTFRVGVDGTTHQVHRLVAYAFLGAPPKGEFTVDHLNQQPGDNRASNLRWASRHAQRVNQGVRKRSRLSKPVLLTDAGGSAVEFPSVLDAANAIGANSGNVSTAAHHGRLVNGYRAEFKPSEDQSNLVVDGEVERWAATAEDPDLYVSTMGRIQRRRFSVWGHKMTPGTKKRFGGYCAVRVGNKDDLMHRLVLQTFGNPAPEDGKIYTVDHVNQRRCDNRLINLRWATHSEQNRNKRRVASDTKG